MNLNNGGILRKFNILQKYEEKGREHFVLDLPYQGTIVTQGSLQVHTRNFRLFENQIWPEREQ